MTTYTIEPQGSRVSIEARSSLHPIHSETHGLEGWFEADVLGGGRINPRVDPRGHLELPVERLSSGNPLYDREMRRRIDARRHPTIAGDLTAMEATSDEGRYQVSGEVTFRGTTNTYTDEMLLSFPEDGVVHLEGSHQFDIRDFAMQPPKIFTLRVHPDVTVTVAIVARSDGST
ncbi:MAG TPA: YceI family protein [Acidimicrobiales bacterium]|jgi:polyisoprenoid-binding protein YceI|nr:YceI family protein [Acidimicrobiales bacterium]